jgi:hypothetical protein
VTAVTAVSVTECDSDGMKTFDHPPSYLARIREFEALAADTTSPEMVGVLRRLVRAYREVARNEICCGREAAAPRERRIRERPPTLCAVRIQALTQG